MRLYFWTTLYLILAMFSALAIAPMVAVRESATDMSAEYNADVLDIQYHDSDRDIARDEIPLAGPTMWTSMSVSPPSAYVPVSGGAPGAPNFVPNYEESVYMSRSSGQSQVAQFAHTLPPTDFCRVAAGDKRKTETACNALAPNACVRTDCCVLLGGKKCVAGKETGPLLSGNYIDTTIEHKDKYYYGDTCYGNCREGDKK